MSSGCSSHLCARVAHISDNRNSVRAGPNAGKAKAEAKEMEDAADADANAEDEDFTERVCEQRRQQRRQQLKLPQLPSADMTDLCGFLWSRRCGVTVGERRCAPQWETAGFGVC